MVSRLHIREGAIFKLAPQTEITDAAARNVFSHEQKAGQPLASNQLKSNDDYGIRHQCIALIILRDIYLTPQQSCLASRRKSPINGGNNHHFLCSGGRGETGKITERNGGEITGNNNGIEMLGAVLFFERD